MVRWKSLSAGILKSTYASILSNTHQVKMACSYIYLLKPSTPGLTQPHLSPADPYRDCSQCWSLWSRVPGPPCQHSRPAIFSGHCFKLFFAHTVTGVREGIKTNVFLGYLSQTWVGGVADSQTRSKPLKTSPNHLENHLFRPKFHLLFSESFGISDLNNSNVVLINFLFALPNLCR